MTPSVVMAVAILAAALMAEPVHAFATCTPTDQAAEQSDFLAFRNALREAVTRRDAGALMASVDANIRNGFGGDDGAAAFEKRWRPRDADSALWRELGDVLALGGVFENKDTFVAPYTYKCDTRDPFAEVVVIAKSVRVRSGPAPTAPIIGIVGHSVIGLAPKATLEGEWTHVLLWNGRTGYVATRYLRSPVAHRAFFSRTPSGWKMTAFVSGD